MRPLVLACKEAGKKCLIKKVPDKMKHSPGACNSLKTRRGYRQSISGRVVYHRYASMEIGVGTGVRAPRDKQAIERSAGENGERRH